MIGLPKTKRLWMLYFAFRSKNFSKLAYKERIYWMKHGYRAYREMLPFDEYRRRYSV